MLGWGSWANTLKYSSARGWKFELYYWDYVIGMVVAAIGISLTFGSHGHTGVDALTSLDMANAAILLASVLSGLLFNASNILIVIATDMAGIAVAFPLAVGLAVVIGTSLTYAQAPSGHPIPLFFGLALLICAMILAAVASGQRSDSDRTRRFRGVLFAIASGCIMGFFYPRLASSISINPALRDGKLTPYAAIIGFAVGLLVSNLLINTLLIRARNATYAQYFRGRPALHLAGFAGGMIWMIALAANLVAASVAGAAVSYALGQGATLVAAIWGVFIWREFRGCPRKVTFALVAMFASYICGLVAIGSAAF
jgi:glucose uptake protein